VPLEDGTAPGAATNCVMPRRHNLLCSHTGSKVLLTAVPSDWWDSAVRNLGFRQRAADIGWYWALGIGWQATAGLPAAQCNPKGLQPGEAASTMGSRMQQAQDVRGGLTLVRLDRLQTVSVAGATAGTASLQRCPFP
jgi:hypothetical protein